MAIDEFARPIDLKNQPGDDEKKLLEQLKGLVSEADESKKRQLKRYDETSDEDDLKVYRGEIGPKEKFFDCNFVQAFIDRQVAQLTDNRPILRVENRKIGLHDVARVLQKAILNVWDQSNVQRNTFKMAYSAAVSRSAGMYTGWDPVAEDIYLEVIRKDQVRIDPCVTEAAMLNEAEYIIIERIKPIAEIKRRFGARGFLVKSDVQLHPGESKKPTVFSALTDILKSKSSQGLKDAIPRAYIYEAIVKDRQVDIQNRPLFPFGRQIFFSDDVVLYDGPLSFWDGQVPLDWFDWIVDPEHIWGHCLVAGTRISTERGIIPITEARTCKETESGPILDFIPQGTRPVYTLTTKRGYSVTGTANHRIKKADGEWVDLGASHGETIKLTMPRFSDEIYVCEWRDVPCSATRMVISQEWGRFLGYFMGDGSYHGSKGGSGSTVSTSSLEVACFSGDQDVIDDVSQLLRGLFGKDPSHVHASKNGMRVRVRGQSLFQPLYACDSIAQYGDSGRWRRRICVPEVIWRSPKPVVREFLSALLETDGSADLRGRVTLASKHDDFLRDVQLLLLGFGITCSIKPGVGKNRCSKIHMNILESARFHDEIGFIGERKRSRNKRAQSARRKSCIPIEMHDTVVSVHPAGEEPVFDLTLPDPHTFSANGIAVHNSEPYRLRKLQSAFNQIMDGTVENHIITNVLAVIGDYDALSREDWQTLQNMRGTMILRKRNRAATVDLRPPPPFGADKIQLARTLFTYGQLLTGVTDVTMGETPGSLQSGLAIEGLQEGANLMTRSRASRLEDFYNRVGQKLISRILQFVPSDRILSALGPTKEALEYAKNRADLFIDDDGNPIKFEARRDALKWLRFSVLPGSSQPGTRQRRAQGMMALHGAGMASRRRVLEAADFHDTDTMLAEAEADFQKFPPPGWVKKGPN